MKREKNTQSVGHDILLYPQFSDNSCCKGVAGEDPGQGLQLQEAHGSCRGRS